MPGAVIAMIHRTYSPTKLDCNSEFFANFTYHGIFHAFAWFDFSTWQPPVVRFRASSSFDKKYLRSFDDRRSAAQARFGFSDRSGLIGHSSSVTIFILNRGFRDHIVIVVDTRQVGLRGMNYPLGERLTNSTRLQRCTVGLRCFGISSMFSHGGFTPLTGTSGFFPPSILRNLIYLGNPACVARFSWKRRCEPARDGVFGLIESKKPKAEGERICVVVFARRHENIEMLSGSVHLFVSRVTIVERAANAFKPVSYDCFALSGSPGNDGATVFPRSDVFRKFFGGNGNDSRVVVLRIVYQGTAVFDFAFELIADIFDKLIFGFKSGMVRGEIHFHGDIVAPSSQLQHLQAGSFSQFLVVLLGFDHDAELVGRALNRGNGHLVL